MLLTVDVGNTHTVYGLFRQDRLVAHWRTSTREEVTEDELGVLLLNLFRGVECEPRSISGMIVSCVVPGLSASLQRFGRTYLACDVLFVRPGVKTGLPIHFENPHEVGADRIVNSVAARERYGSPVIVLDFGTATTFDVVGHQGEYLGGVIAPGVGVSAEALFQRAARLHPVDIAKPSRVIGRFTEEGLQSGLFFGYVGLVEGIVARIRDELGEEAPVVATGGMSAVLADELPCLHATDPELTLLGLRLIWEKNQG